MELLPYNRHNHCKCSQSKIRHYLSHILLLPPSNNNGQHIKTQAGHLRFHIQLVGFLIKANLEL